MFHPRPMGAHFLAYQDLTGEARVAVAAIPTAPQGPIGLAAAVGVNALASLRGTTFEGRIYHTATAQPAGPSFGSGWGADGDASGW